jgi:hypothetical protein
MWKQTEAGSFPLPGIENEDSETALRRLAQDGNITMSSELLKARAKRLRPAITAMLGVPVGHSQSLELVAQEENYPNWDAACASYAPDSTPRLTKPKKPFQLNVAGVPGARPGFCDLFGNDPHLVSELNRVLGNAQTGGLVLIGSITAQGKSTTAKAVVEHVVDTLAPGNSVVQVGAIDILYPDCLLARRISEFDSCLSGGPMSDQIVLIDEIRTERMAFEAVALAKGGLKVIATVHAWPSPYQRLNALLGKFGVGESLLVALEAAGQLVTIQQTLDWATPLARRQAKQERQRGMLRRAGFKGDYMEQLVAQGDNAVQQALLSCIEP